MSNTFRPSRRFRREFGHKPCPACGNRVDPSDLLAVTGDGTTYYVHESCAQLLGEIASDADNE